MSNVALTLRLSATAGRRLARIAKREGRTPEAQAERMLTDALKEADGRRGKRGARALAGVLRQARVPSIDEFREARSALGRTLGADLVKDDRPRR